MKVSILLAQHNVPLSLADHLSPLIRDIFDGSTAKGYACAKTKTSCILNRAVAPLFKNELISAMASIPYALSVDGSNDTGLEKINPLTVRIFDEENGKVNMRFLDMCITTGDKAATAEVIFIAFFMNITYLGITVLGLVLITAVSIWGGTIQ